jgi:D-aspartate ligase
MQLVNVSTANYDAIVLGAGPNGLGAVRGLAKKGVRVYLITYVDTDPSIFSRCPVKKTTLKSSSQEHKEIELIQLLDAAHPGAVVIPTSDWFVSVLGSYRDLHPQRFKTCMPTKQIAAMVIDKALETECMAQVVPMPKTIQQLPDTSAKLLEQLRLPIIFKPRSFAHYKLKQKTIQVWNEQELQKFYQRFGEHLESTIAQEIIPGDDSCLWVCNCTFNNDSKLADAFVFRRLSLSPPHYGVTSYAISEANPQVLAEVEKIGAHLKFVGPAMIEFKYDYRDQNYKYIELNPRLGMCNYFDTSCGVTNAFNTYRLARGESLPPRVPTQRNGVIFVSFYEDIFSRKVDGQKWSKIFSIYAADFMKPHVFIYFAASDPLPAIVQLWRNISVIASSIVKKFPGKKDIK